jgi:hypothetical protein
MEIYRSEGGAYNPHFRYSVIVNTVTAEAYGWLQDYPGLECFDRFWINWTGREQLGYLEVQFEREQPAIMFRLKYGHQ